MESLYVELNCEMTSGFLIVIIIFIKILLSTHIDKLSKSLELFSPDYEKVIFLGDFNVGVNDNHMKSFCENYGLKNLIKQPTCYKNPSNSTCIAVIITNVPRGTCVIETGA